MRRKRYDSQNAESVADHSLHLKKNHRNNRNIFFFTSKTTGPSLTIFDMDRFLTGRFWTGKLQSLRDSTIKSITHRTLTQHSLFRLADEVFHIIQLSYSNAHKLRTKQSIRVEITHKLMPQALAFRLQHLFKKISLQRK